MANKADYWNEVARIRTTRGVTQLEARAIYAAEKNGGGAASNGHAFDSIGHLAPAGVIELALKNITRLEQQIADVERQLRTLQTDLQDWQRIAQSLGSAEEQRYEAAIPAGM